MEFQPSALVLPIEYSGLISFRMDWFNLLEPQFPHLQGPETLCDHQLTFELDQGSGRLLPLSPVLGMYALYTIFTVGTIFENASWIEQCGLENNWTECD